MSDLFTPPSPNDQTQETYLACLTYQWQKDLQTVQTSNIRPPWVNTDVILDRDELAVLKLLADSETLYWGGQQCRLLARRLGYDSTGNCKATIHKALDRGLVTCVLDGDMQRLQITHHGMWLLEMVEEDREYD